MGDSFQLGRIAGVRIGLNWSWLVVFALIVWTLAANRLFGGVAKFKGMFPSAGAEFRIAIAGPLVSLALGALFADDW